MTDKHRMTACKHLPSQYHQEYLCLIRRNAWECGLTIKGGKDILVPSGVLVLN
ncbi:hypothetical protein J6590_077694 [Homalodisca vitripennis]|nr:hypothetical protein J6590_077694 [Homalodisca vitripennis]